MFTCFSLLVNCYFGMNLNKKITVNPPWPCLLYSIGAAVLVAAYITKRLPYYFIDNPVSMFNTVTVNSCNGASKFTVYLHYKYLT